ncbi:MAG: sensor histidine kinase [Promethearchaeota archaeon]
MKNGAKYELRDIQTIIPWRRISLEKLLDIPRILSQPSDSITDGGQRRRARFLRTALFTAVCAFPILQITSRPTQGYPLYSLLAFFGAGVYLLSGTSHLKLASALSIICAASIPFISFMLQENWSRDEVAFLVLTWPILSVLLASQLISIRIQALLGGVITVGLLLTGYLHPGIFIIDAMDTISVFLAVSVLLMFTTWNQDYYSARLERSNKANETRRKELEIYTSLMRHDLGNDVQMILGGIELSQMANGEPRQAAFLESSYAAAQRMKSLLHIFSMSEAELDTDIVTVLEKIGRRAEIAFGGMKVLIQSTEDVRKNPPKYGRLLALAFENLFRNTSQHAGDNPNVEIILSKSDNTLEIQFGDDGPGIDSSILENLFEKGVSTGPEGKGLGLYLTKRIVESEEGRIIHKPHNNRGCCFIIRLPFDNGR